MARGSIPCLSVLDAELFVVVHLESVHGRFVQHDPLHAVPEFRIALRHVDAEGGEKGAVGDDELAPDLFLLFLIAGFERAAAVVVSDDALGQADALDERQLAQLGEEGLPVFVDAHVHVDEDDLLFVEAEVFGLEVSQLAVDDQGGDDDADRGDELDDDQGLPEEQHAVAAPGAVGVEGVDRVERAEVEGRIAPGNDAHSEGQSEKDGPLPPLVHQDEGVREADDAVEERQQQVDQHDGQHECDEGHEDRFGERA